MQSRLIVSYFLFLFTLLIKAQSNLNIAIEEVVLKKKQINCITKDYKNRIWCGTNDGVYCYDGYQIISFRNEGEAQLISNNYVQCVATNKDSSILVFGTKNCITWLDAKSMKVYFTLGSSVKNGLSIKNCEKLIYVGGDEFFGIANGNIFSLQINGGKTKIDFLKIDENSKDAYLNIFKSDCNKSEILVYTKNLKVYSFNKLRKTKICIEDSLRGVTYVSCRDSIFIFGTYHGLINKNKTNLKKVVLRAEINLVQKDRTGNLYVIANRSKLYKYQVGSTPNLVFEFSETDLSNYKNVFQIIIDNNNFWIATSNGLIKLKKTNSGLNKIISESSESGKFNSGDLSSRGMFQYNDTCVLLCGYHYFATYNPITNTVRRLISKEESDNLHMYALSVINDSVWIACEGVGIKLFSLSKWKFLKSKLNNPSKAEFEKYGLIRTATKFKDWIYFGEYGFIARLNYKSRLLEIDQNFKMNKLFDSRNTISIINHNEEELIVVNPNEVIIFDSLLRIKKRFKPEFIGPSLKGLIICVTKDEKYFWIGTNSLGLYKLNHDFNVIKHYNIKNGLPDNTIYSLVDTKDKLLIGTKNGLAVFNKKTDKIFNFYKEDGLAGNEFNTNSNLILRNGDVLMGGVNGVTRINPNLIYQDSSNTNYFISKIVMLGDNFLSDSIIYGDLDNLKSIDLPYQKRFIQIYFAVSNCDKNNKFAYKIKNIDDRWINLENSNSITFNSLSPGEYHLVIRAWDGKNMQVGKDLEIVISAKQIFYKTPLFIFSFSVLFIAILLIGVFLYYRNKVKNLNKLANLRLKIASELHDQVGGLINKTALQAELVNSKNQMKDPQLNRISVNSREALNSMRDILWNLDPRNDNTESLIERMKEFAMKMLGDEFDYQIKFSNLEDLELTHEVRQNLNMIYRESINNIVKHAAGSKVEISFSRKQNQLALRVKSSNPLKSEIISSGQGMRNMKMRAAAIKANLIVETEDGVVIDVILPINHMKM
ncbi:MAG: hypothetical protein IPM51_09900 [Sphingobacteriaceae bacterium]|nr:hypothetical protein [Sphingobacteriaceae bacterium]